MRGRITVAAAATGAFVAAGQTVLSSGLLPTPVESETITSTGLLPVAATKATSAQTAFALNGAAGNQALPGSAAAASGTSTVDVKNLAKAVELGQALAKKSAIMTAALSSGAKEAHLFKGEAFVRPTSGRLTSTFGARWGTSHLGIDIAAPIGTPIYAFTDGVVDKAGPASGFGLWVVLLHPDGTRSVYGHVNRMFVQEGQQVRAGDRIAEVGNRGQSTGPHLHLEIWDANKTKLNPIPWLKKHGIAFDGSGDSAPSDGAHPSLVDLAVSPDGGTDDDSTTDPADPTTKAPKPELSSTDAPTVPVTGVPTADGRVLAAPDRR